MGVPEEPRIDTYWNSEKRKGTMHTFSTHITLNRYEEVKRYCHISNAEDDERSRASFTYQFSMAV